MAGHIQSYKDVEHLFAHFRPKDVRNVKKVHRVSFWPKHGTILVEMKDGKGVLFTANSDRENGETIYICTDEVYNEKECKEAVQTLKRLEKGRIMNKIEAIIRIKNKS